MGNRDANAIAAISRRAPKNIASPKTMAMPCENDTACANSGRFQVAIV
jgi:hypothetical protein